MAVLINPMGGKWWAEKKDYFDKEITDVDVTAVGFRSTGIGFR